MSHASYHRQVGTRRHGPAVAMKGKSADALIDVALFFPDGGHVKYQCMQSRRHVLRRRFHVAYQAGGMDAVRTFRDFLMALLPENR